eukprot:gb/GFBE01022168.1/.p1 GENE.gb/GFBE01022168.1/~~gb/GFBE01022168.1/.p1  ORF type:complete len:571 (+),score=97.19 gb/GFBE01022168.1/:1-1713(+)
MLGSYVKMACVLASFAMCAAAILSTLNRCASRLFEKLAAHDWTFSNVSLVLSRRSEPITAREADISARANALAMERMLKNSDFCWKCVPFFAWIPMAMVIIRIVNTTSSIEELESHRYLYLVSLSGILGSAAHVVPTRIKNKLLLMSTFCLHAVMMVTLLSSRGLLEFLAVNSAVSAVRVASAGFLETLPLSITLNVAWLVFGLYHWMSPFEHLSSARLALCDSQDSDAGCRIAKTVVIEAVVSALSVGVCAMVTGLVKAESRAVIEGKLAHQSDSTAQSLIKSLSDAVVCLDANLRITSEASKLASLLQEPPRALLGSDVCDLLVEEDKEVLKKQLETCKAREVLGAHVQSATVNFVDSTGNRVMAQVLHNLFLDLDNQPNHCLAVRLLDLEQVPVPMPSTTHVESCCGFIVIDTVEYRIARCQPPGMLTDLRSRGNDDFRTCLLDPGRFQDHVAVFCSDCCVDVFDMLDQSRCVDENDVGGAEIVLQRPIGLHSLKRTDQQSVFAGEPVHLTLETTASLFFSDRKPFIKVCINTRLPGARGSEGFSAEPSMIVDEESVSRLGGSPCSL